MSDNEPQIEPSEESEQITVSGDSILNFMVHLAENGAGAAVTVFTSGQCFTGQLCSRKSYFEASNKLLEGTAYSVIFEEFLGAIVSDEGNEQTPDYHYVHMAKGRIIAPGGSPIPKEGVPLRIDRAAVIGWHIGELRPSE